MEFGRLLLDESRSVPKSGDEAALEFRQAEFLGKVPSNPPRPVRPGGEHVTSDQLEEPNLGSTAPGVARSLRK